MPSAEKSRTRTQTQTSFEQSNGNILCQLDSTKSTTRLQAYSENYLLI